MALTLTSKNATTLPVDAGPLSPDVLTGLAASDVARRLLWHGNAQAEVGELFDVKGSADDGEVILEGQLRGLRSIGAGMKSGRLTVRSDAGPFTAAGMAGGECVVEGSAGAWAGAEMTGGVLRIAGDAGLGVGAALAGSRAGMRGGAILVGGSVGADAGLAMRRGLIAIRGAAGTGLGRSMIAGSVFAFGPVGTLAGWGMRRGTIALFGGAESVDVLPTFARSGRDRPPFLTIYLKKLIEWGVDVPAAVFSGALARYNGDRSAGGQGELLVWDG